MPPLDAVVRCPAILPLVPGRLRGAENPGKARPMPDGAAGGPLQERRLEQDLARVEPGTRGREACQLRFGHYPNGPGRQGAGDFAVQTMAGMSGAVRRRNRPCGRSGRPANGPIREDQRMAGSYSGRTYQLSSGRAGSQCGTAACSRSPRRQMKRDGYRAGVLCPYRTRPRDWRQKQ